MIKNNDKKRTDDLRVRVTAEEKRRIEKAAERMGQSVSAWLRMVALKWAKLGVSIVWLVSVLVGCSQITHPSLTGFQISNEPRKDGRSGSLINHWCKEQFKIRFQYAADMWRRLGAEPVYLWNTQETDFKGFIFSINIGLEDNNRFFGATVGGVGRYGNIEFKESIVCCTDLEFTKHIIAHEVGHAFGLDHTRTGIMAAFSNATEFSDEDIQEWQRVYDN